MPAIVERRWTAEEVRALPDVPGTRYECIDGVLLVTPAPSTRHQVVQAELLRLLNNYVAAERRGIVFTAPKDYVLDTYTVVQPDISVVPLLEGKPPRVGEELERALLFIEILSPSTARDDRGVKREKYQREGIEYWIVDADARVIERWLHGDDRPEVLSQTVTWQWPGHPERFTLALPEFFAWVWGE